MHVCIKLWVGFKRVFGTHETAQLLDRHVLEYKISFSLLLTLGTLPEDYLMELMRLWWSNIRISLLKSTPSISCL